MVMRWCRQGERGTVLVDPRLGDARRVARARVCEPSRSWDRPARFRGVRGTDSVEPGAGDWSG